MRRLALSISLAALLATLLASAALAGHLAIKSSSVRFGTVPANTTSDTFYAKFTNNTSMTIRWGVVGLTNGTYFRYVVVNSGGNPCDALAPGATCRIPVYIDAPSTTGKLTDVLFVAWYRPSDNSYLGTTYADVRARVVSG